MSDMQAMRTTQRMDPEIGAGNALATGNPQFADAELQQQCDTHGALAAWRAAFQRHGASAPARVRGDFAVALTLDDGRSFMAVDRFAIQTLCYSTSGGQLRFARRADEVGGQREIDPQAVFDYLYFHCIPSPGTIFKGVRRLPPAHCAEFRRGQLELSRYWIPEFSEGDGRPLQVRKDDFLQIVESAVADRSLEGKTGCYLSGGTDSSTVAGMLTRVSGQPAESFSIGFDVPGYDEMEYARIAARHFGTRHHEFYIRPEHLVEGMPLVAASYDQPFGNSSAVPAYYCARMARELGLERLLAGDGGDELFGGNTRYAKQKVFGLYEQLPGWLRSGLAEPITDSGLLDPIPLLKKGASYVRQARQPMPDRMQSYNLLTRLGIENIFSPDFLAEIDREAPMALQREVYKQVPPCSLVNQMLAYDWRFTLAENDLPKVLGSARLAGIDARFPLLDDRLLEFSLAVASRDKVRGAKLRWFFKEALRGFLPDAILAKKKHGFGLPFGHWAVSHKGLVEFARDTLSRLTRRGLIRKAHTNQLLSRDLVAYPGFYGELLWIYCMLELWLQSALPGGGPTSVCAPPSSAEAPASIRG